MGESLLGSNLFWSPFEYTDPKDTKIKELSRKINELENIKKVDLPERYIINDGATVLIWKDGTKTIVRKCEDDEFNPRLAYLTAFFQHYCGMSKNKANKYLASLEIEKKAEIKEEKPKAKTLKKSTRVGRPRKLKVGDRVVEEDFGKGTIIYNDGTKVLNILVQFDKEDRRLHDGLGKGKKYHCFWCNEGDLKKERK